MLRVLLLTFVFPTLLVAQTKSLVITHVTVIDMVTSTPKTDMTVVVNGDRITSIGKANKVRSPTNAEVINGRGKFLIPGLWDMHFHGLQPDRPDYYFPLFIANGITGYRDMGTTEDGFASSTAKRDCRWHPCWS